MKRSVFAWVLFALFAGAPFVQPASSQPDRASEQGQNAEEPSPHKAEAKAPNETPPPTEGGNEPTEAGGGNEKQHEGRVPGYLSTAKDAFAGFVEFADRNDKAIVAVGTIFIAAFTVILGLATIFLWRATVALVKGADRNAEKQLRAYVVIESIGLDFLGPQPLARATVTTKNAGQTPALNFATNICLRWATTPIEEIMVVRRPRRVGVAPLMPSQTNITICDLNYSDHPELPDFIRAGAFGIYLTGTMVYDDVFGHRHIENVDMVATDERAFSRSPFVYDRDQSLKKNEATD